MFNDPIHRTQKGSGNDGVGGLKELQFIIPRNAEREKESIFKTKTCVVVAVVVVVSVLLCIDREFRILIEIRAIVNYVHEVFHELD